MSGLPGRTTRRRGACLAVCTASTLLAGCAAGVGIGVNQRGQVSASAGVGASAPVGDARVGAGVGTGTVLHDPATSDRPASGNAP